MKLSYSVSTGATLKGREHETQPVAVSSAIRDVVREISAPTTESIAIDMQTLSMVEDDGFNVRMAYL